MQITEIITDETLREIREHGTPEFPFEYYLDDIDEIGQGYVEWHWHNEIEWAWVESGKVICRIGNEKIILEAGEGIFINSRVIHRFETPGGALMPNILHAPELLAARESAIYQKYVSPVITYGKEYVILEKEKNDILKEAYEKADRMMKEMQSKAAALVEKIQKEDNKKEDIKNVQKSLNMLRSALQSDKSKTVIEKPKVARKVDFKVGERVFVNSLNQFANVLKINLSKETTQVQAGILKLEVSLDDVKVVEEKKQKVYNSFSHKKTAVRSEIDLRGKMVDEAVYELETYLDRAIMNSYNEVYVIHGKGTGALREGILNYLKKCPYVKEYRIGGHGEGGLGCTVVTLK